MFLEKFFKKTKEDVHIFSSLDELPFYNWLNAYSEKNLVYLIKNVNYRTFEITPTIEIKLEAAWDIIYDEYLELFGMTKKFKRVVELERQIALLKCDLWIDDNKFLKNKIKIFEKKLQREKQNAVDDKGNDYDRQTVLIEKWLNSSLDIKKISAKKYYTYLQLIQEEADQMKMKEAKNG